MNRYAPLALTVLGVLPLLAARATIRWARFSTSSCVAARAPGNRNRKGGPRRNLSRKPTRVAAPAILMTISSARCSRPAARHVLTMSAAWKTSSSSSGRAWNGTARPLRHRGFLVGQGGSLPFSTPSCALGSGVFQGDEPECIVHPPFARKNCPRFMS